MAGTTFDASSFYRSMDGMVQRSGNAATAYERIAARMLAETLNRFKSTTAPDGSKWVPLSASTVAQRRKGSAVPLQDTGRLRGATRHKSQADRAIVYNDMEYAAIHNEGGQAGRGRRVKIPKRQFIGLSASEVTRYNKLMQRYIIEGVI